MYLQSKCCLVCFVHITHVTYNDASMLLCFMCCVVLKVSILLCSYNVSHLEDWCHDNHLRGAVVDQLRPIKEAAKLLQLRKATEKDAVAVVDLCTHLSSLQVCTVDGTSGGGGGGGGGGIDMNLGTDWLMIMASLSLVMTSNEN